MVKLRNQLKEKERAMSGSNIEKAVGNVEEAAAKAALRNGAAGGDAASTRPQFNPAKAKGTPAGGRSAKGFVRANSVALLADMERYGLRRTAKLYAISQQSLSSSLKSLGLKNTNPQAVKFRKAIAARSARKAKRHAPRAQKAKKAQRVQKKRGLWARIVRFFR
jgi:hypothetical protein